MLRSDNFPESKENLVRLPEDDAMSFAVFAEYLYMGEEVDTGAVHRDISGDDPESEMEVEDDNMAHDQYDFMLQFSCYVLADKLQANGFKRHIMDEIRRHGEFCDPADLTVDHIRYAYDNTVRQNDPLRRLCLMMRCKRIPMEHTINDPKFIALMEEGGPLVRVMMAEGANEDTN